MKSLQFMMAIVAMIWSANAFSQTNSHTGKIAVKTETIRVWGNCDLCKTRIEKAAKINGVSKAEWNMDTKILTLVYYPSMVSREVVQKKIAAAGHDTEKFKATDEAYNSLPGCCLYERNK
jgi:copper chaperone CopZ